MMNQILKIISICLVFILLCFFQTLQAQNGIVKSYYADGTVQSEASYVNDVLDGAYITYFANGKVKTGKNYSQGILDGYVREYYATGLMKEEYFVKTGIKDGSQRRYFENGQLKELINYSDGIQIQKQVFTFDPAHHASLEASPVGNKQQNVLPEKELLCDVQVCPVPIGGMKVIHDSLIYPEHALRYGLEGTVTIIATINTQGEVIKTQVLKKLGLGCDEAAQEVLRKTKFIPGKSNGVAVETNATINIEFKIFDKKSVQ